MQIIGGMNFSGGMSIVIPVVPPAPTIGSATFATTTSATVSFTAPNTDGGAVITKYTAVSSPDNITATLNQSGSGTITVTGLTPNTTYTFVVYATNSAGDGANSDPSNSTTIPAERLLGVASGSMTSAIIDKNYNVWLWGYGRNGELGDNTTISKSSPIQLGIGSYWRYIQGGEQASYGIKLDYTLWAWGQNVDGRLGLNDKVYRSSPIQIGSSNNWEKLATPGPGTGGAAGAINSLGQLFVWGVNVYGGLGLGDTLYRSSPVQLPGSWSMASIGYGSSIALNNLGQIFTWGDGRNGTLGTNSTLMRSSPAQIMTTSSFVAVSASDGHQSAIDITGKLWIWGVGSSGQVGPAYSTVNKSSPVMISGTWASASLATGLTLAINTAGKLFAWGTNSHGELGLNDRISRSSPTQVGTSSWTQISVGDFGPIGVTISNAVFTWGRDDAGTYPAGRIGSGTTIDRSAPYQVGTY